MRHSRHVYIMLKGMPWRDIVLNAADDFTIGYLREYLALLLFRER